MSQNTQSIDFELSSSQYASGSDSTSLSPTATITLECWIKLEQLASSAGTDMHVINKYDGVGNQRAYRLFIRTADDKLELDISSDGTTNGAAITEAIGSVAFTSADVGVWIHIVVTYLAATTTAIFYRNGVAMTTTYGNQNATTIFDSTASFNLSTVPGGGAYLDGKLDEVRVWNIVRTVADIQRDMRRELYGNETGLAAYYKLNSNFNDSTANANTLTATNGPLFSSDVPFSGADIAIGYFDV